MEVLTTIPPNSLLRLTGGLPSDRFWQIHCGVPVAGVEMRRREFLSGFGAAAATALLAAEISSTADEVIE